MAKTKATVFEGVSNGAKEAIDQSAPYTVDITIEGTAKMLMHCWNNEAVNEKAIAKKGSAQKKTDNLESYVLRDEDDYIVIPTLNFCASIRDAGKSFADPASPRKSMRDRLKAIIVPDKEFARINNGQTQWDFVDARRVVIKMAGITRNRPGFYEGWRATFRIMVLEPEFLPLAKLIEITDSAGKFNGLGDFRPTFGRYRVADVQVIE